MFAKAVRDRVVFTATIGGITLFWLAFGMGVYSGFDDDALSFVSDMPEALQAMYGGTGGTSAEIIGGTMFGMVAPAMLLIFTISGGSWASTGEERSKTLALLLANPVSRTRVLLTKAAVVALGTVVLVFVIWAGAEGIAAVVGMDMGTQDLAAASIQMAGLGAMFGALALAIGAGTGRSIGSGVAGGLAAVSYLVTTLLPTNPDLETVAKFTPWYLYSGPEPLRNGVDWAFLAAMLGIAAVLALYSVLAINRRDLRE